MTRDHDLLAEFTGALAESLGEPCRAEVTGNRTLAVLMSDGDWTLRQSQNLVRWQVTIRECPPGLGTGWCAGDFDCSPADCSVPELARRLTETMAELRGALGDRMQRRTSSKVGTIFQR